MERKDVTTVEELREYWQQYDNPEVYNPIIGKIAKVNNIEIFESGFMLLVNENDIAIGIRYINFDHGIENSVLTGVGISEGIVIQIS